MYWTARGDASFLEGNYKDAIEWYKKALEIDPGSTRTWNNLRDAYLNAGDTENACSCLQKIQSLHQEPGVGNDSSPSFIQFFISTLVNLLVFPKKAMKSLAPTEVTTAIYFFIALWVIAFLGGYIIHALYVSYRNPGPLPLAIYYPFPYMVIFLLIGLQVLAFGILTITTRFCCRKWNISETAKAAVYGFTPGVLSFPVLYGLFVCSLTSLLPVDMNSLGAIILVFALLSGYLITLGLSEFHKIPKRDALYSVFSCYILVFVLFFILIYTRIDLF